MSEPATVAAMPQGRKLQANQGFITGRIFSRRRINTQQGHLYLTVLKLPAPDQYSHPATVELRSTFQLGDVDSDWSGPVQLGGMPNSYDQQDKETGDRTRIISARNEYTVIE